MQKRDGNDDHSEGGGSSSIVSTTATVTATATTTATKTQTTSINPGNGQGSSTASPNAPEQSTGNPVGQPSGMKTPNPPSVTPGPISPSSIAASPGTANPTTVTVSSPSTSSPPSTIFLFNDPTNTTVCTTLGLSWTYTGQVVVAMTLTIQAQGQDQVGSTTASSNMPSASSSTFRILTTEALSNAASFTWSLVDVKEGWYIAKAFDTADKLGISAGSSPFFVTQGNDTSCLLTTNTSSTVNPSPSQTASPGPSDSRGFIGTGDIVGIALGVTAGLICLIVAAFTFPRLRRREPPDPATKRRRPYLLY
ncbi:hypothetical protein BDZ97DRAFT_1754351 [Flammula alnicola]|nr:hypothetical protein BDZ97DRAFT_1754351 [Flammula alnicola]